MEGSNIETNQLLGALDFVQVQLESELAHLLPPHVSTIITPNSMLAIKNTDLPAAQLMAMASSIFSLSDSLPPLV